MIKRQFSQSVLNALQGFTLLFIRGSRQSDLLKLLASLKEMVDLYHFRTSDGKEVDFVLEYPNGTLPGIEAKARDAFSKTDFHGLQELRRETDNDFFCGVVLYRGQKTISFGDRLWAVPTDST